MLFMVSEPTLLMFPETPEVFWYDGRAGSTFTAWAAAWLAKSGTVATATSKRFMDDSSNRMRAPPGTCYRIPGNGRLRRCKQTVNSPPV
jgi:hypothetical protein